jgi:branched-chain amino acid transport system substrate-binding protein
MQPGEPVPGAKADKGSWCAAPTVYPEETTMRMTTPVLGTAIAGLVAASVMTARAQDSIFVPNLTYRTGPFSNSGIPIANGISDYFAMLNARDGGIGGAKINYEECETGYRNEKGVECYEALKSKKPVVITPYSTGITLALIPKASVDRIPILSMAYGLSASAVGQEFPWIFNPPGGYGLEPVPLLDQFARDYGFTVKKYPVPPADMQNQSGLWLGVRRDRPNWMIMWGWGAMNPAAVQEAAKINFPMDHFVGIWWSGSEDDARPASTGGKGYLSLNLNAVGANFPAIQDIITHVVAKGASQTARERVGENFYNRGIMNAALIAEAIRNAQALTGKKAVDAPDVRRGLETLKITAARWKEMGLEKFAAALEVTCTDHNGHHAAYMQQWDGAKWVKISDWIAPMKDKVQPLLDAAAKDYVSKNQPWPRRSEACDKSS